MKLVFCLVVQLLLVGNALAAGEVKIRFTPAFGGKPVVLEDKYYYLPSGDSVVFETIRFYISDVVFLKNGQPVYREAESYHLIDAADVESMAFAVKLPAGISYDNISFHLGIDSATSTSGALGGDLDPAKGMFWTWQSGYINCKIEGRSNLCPTRHHEFGLHLGGYATPHCAMQEITLPASGAVVTVKIALDRFLSEIELGKEHSIMSPGPVAARLSKKLAKQFSVQ